MTRNGNGEDRTVAVLLDIQAELRGLREDSGRGFAELRAEMHAGFERLDARIDQTNERLDKVIENTGKHGRDLERRVEALEGDVSRLRREP
jgi:hypothetical protein